ncbi:MAG: RidA family protein [Bdellovibrionaceae bacterium]|nr:RidA family protein [Pseudobdellovibrionaceae bacterium]
MIFKPILTDKAPQPVGPYSQAIRFGDWLYCSGQIPLDPKNSEVVGQDITAQSKQVFENIKAVLQSQNLSFQNILKTMVFLTDMREFSIFNQIYESYFGDHKPARSCVEVSALPKGVKVEVEVIAFVESDLKKS